MAKKAAGIGKDASPKRPPNPSDGSANSSDALSECQSFFKRTGKVIIPLIVREILDEEIARKLA